MKDQEILERFSENMDMINRLTKLVDKVIDLDKVASERISLINLRLDSMARRIEQLAANGVIYQGDRHATITGADGAGAA